MDTLDAALKYADLGYNVFPCLPNSKAPATSNGFKDASSDPEVIETWWDRCPDANLAIATTGILVLDFDGPWDHPGIEDLNAAPMSTTPRGGRHIWLGRPHGKRWKCSAGRLAPKVDVRTDGGYVLVSPSVIAGNAYTWAPYRDLEDRGPDELPLPPRWLQDLLDDDRTSRPAPTLDGNQIPDGQRNHALAALAGKARRAGCGVDEIRALLQATNLSRCVPPLDQSEVDRIAGSIARYAPDQIEVALVEDHFSQDQNEDTDHSPEVEDPGPFPPELLEVPGFVGEVMRYDLETAIKPQPVLALASALALQGVLAGRKVRDRLANRTNIYCVGVAPSGAGKDHSRHVAKSVLYESGGGDLEGPEEIASDAGLIRSLEIHPTRLYLLDEVGKFLAAIGSSRHAPHLMGIPTTLTKLYSCAGTVYTGRARADDRRTQKIYQPCACLYGTTVSEPILQALTPENLRDGFVARLLVFEAGDVPDQDPRAGPVPRGVLETARAWVEYQTQTRGNLTDQVPHPDLIDDDEDAQVEWREVHDRIKAAIPGSECDARAIWARAKQNTRKLALIYSCSQGPDAVQVTGAAVRWAYQLTEYLTKRMIYLADRWVSEGVFDARQKRVLRTLEDAGGSMTLRNLTRSTRALTVRERTEVLENLKATGLIVVEQNPTRGRISTFVRIAGRAPG